MSKKVWVTGAKGSLGSKICEMLADTEYEVLATDAEVSVADLNVVSSFVEKERPDVVINCAVYRKEITSKQQMAKMYQVNALGPRNLAKVTGSMGIKMIQISTDDVFAGDVSVELTEFDQTFPTTDYGKSKLAGEKYVQSLNPKCMIIRSSWVFGLTGDNFLTYILKMAEDTQFLSVPNDLISTPTSAKELAGFIIQMIESDEYGIYHASCEGSCSRYGFAHAILDAAGITTMQLVPVLTSSKDVRARYTVLRNLMMEITGVYQMPDWQDALKECMKDYKLK